MSNIHQIKRLSIRDYLSRRGIRPARENDRCGFYLSPLREEHTPSFKVDYTLNLWHDFGTGKGGSIIDLVMGLENCDNAQAIRLLDSGEISPVAVAPSSGYADRSSTRPWSVIFESGALALSLPQSIVGR